MQKHESSIKNIIGEMKQQILDIKDKVDSIIILITNKSNFTASRGEAIRPAAFIRGIREKEALASFEVQTIRFAGNHEYLRDILRLRRDNSTCKYYCTAFVIFEFH